MAAHPFGPIEKFLIRSSNRRRFDPASVKPALGPPQLVQIPNANTDPLWEYSGPVKPETLRLKSLAIVNSSECEVEFLPKFIERSLLSRGLGYRITFTMPADREFVITDRESWPSMEVLIMDLSGTHFRHKLLYGVRVDIRWGLIEFLSQYRLVQVDFNANGITIITDGNSQVRFPPTLAQESLSSNFLSEAFDRFAPLVVKQRVYNSDDVNKVLVPGLKDTLALLSRSDPAVCEALRPALQLYLRETFSFFCDLVQKNLRSEESGTESQLLSLQRDLELWLDGHQPYPTYVDDLIIEQILTSSSLQVVGSSGIFWYHIAWMRPFYMVQLSEPLNRLVLAEVERQIKHSRYIPKSFSTRNFTVTESVELSYRPKDSTTDNEVHLVELHETHFPHAVERANLIAVVPHRDLLIVLKEVLPKCDENDDFGFDNGALFEWLLVDLGRNSAAQTSSDIRAEENSFHSIKRKQNRGWSWFAGTTGLFIQAKSEGVKFHAYDGLFQENMQEDPGVQVMVGNFDLKEQHTKIAQSRRSKMYFLMVAIPQVLAVRARSSTSQLGNHIASAADRSGVDYFRFAGLKYRNRSQVLQTIAIADFGLPHVSAWRTQQFWVEGKVGRMFGCITLQNGYDWERIFQLFAVVYHNSKFLVIGSRNRQTRGMFKMPLSQNEVKWVMQGDTVIGMRKFEVTTQQRRNCCILFHKLIFMY